MRAAKARRGTTQRCTRARQPATPECRFAALPKPLARISRPSATGGLSAKRAKERSEGGLPLRVPFKVDLEKLQHPGRSILLFSEYAHAAKQNEYIL